ncbi:alpha/beta fold hydrolase [Nocardia sp. GCM10030253]|uniref:alpha/beta fold hydrolase n=1 Tax=Nocardia sp. GCM10030253 TaxID=3273404 RepID=UPI00362E47A1
MILRVDTPLGEVAAMVTGQDPQSAPTLLLLHANPGDHRDFDAVIPEFGKDWSLVAVDWPGYGRSTAADPRSVTAAGLVDAAEAVLNTLVAKGFRQISVIGNSVGGYVAVRLAQRRPDLITAVVLVQPAGFAGVNPGTRAVCRLMGTRAIARYAVAPSARMYLGPRRTASQQATYERAKQIPRDPRRLDVYCALWRSLADPQCDLVAESPLIPRIPVQVVWGTRDPINPWPLNRRGIARALPQAEVVTLPTRHEPFSEDPDTFLDTVIPFFTRREGARS